MGMKVWLDDLGPEPDEHGFRRPIPAGFTHAKSFKEFQKLMTDNKGQVDDVSLDHDLGEKIEPCLHCEAEHEPCEDCACHHRPMNGCDAVAWMIGSGLAPAKKPGVHSANAPAAMDMRKMLARHYGD